MLIRKLIAAVLLVAAPVSLLPATAAAQVEPAAPSISELLELSSLDQAFAQSGPAMEAAAELHGIPLPAEMARAWRAAAREAFVAETMLARLVEVLEGRITATEASAIAAFYGTPLGRKVGRMDRAVMALEPQAQQRILDEGMAMLSEMGEDSLRRRQLDEMRDLVSADLAANLTAQSIRGMLIGMSVAPQRGDIQIPWDEIDSQLDAIMSTVEADVAASQQAMVAFAYSQLSDAELEEYLQFLRTPEARKFYSLALAATATISGEAMVAFGEALVNRLNEVGA
jgi:hypothetical protein